MSQPLPRHEPRHDEDLGEDLGEDVERPGRASGRALPWVLVAAAAAPVLLAAEAARRYLVGDLDGQFFGYYGASGELVPAPEVSLLERWNAFGDAVPALPALLASALGVAVLTGLVLLDRPRRLVPGTAARWATCGVAVVTAAAAGLLLVLVLVVVTQDVDTNAQGGVTAVPTSSSVVGPVGVALLTGVLTAMAAAVLARPPVRPVADPGVPAPPVEAPAPPTPPVPAVPVVDETVVDETAVDETAVDETVVDGPVPPRPSEPSSPQPSMPRPGDADLELYRRR